MLCFSSSCIPAVCSSNVNKELWVEILACYFYLPRHFLVKFVFIFTLYCYVQDPCRSFCMVYTCYLITSIVLWHTYFFVWWTKKMLGINLFQRLADILSMTKAHRDNQSKYQSFCSWLACLIPKCFLYHFSCATL